MSARYMLGLVVSLIAGMAVWGVLHRGSTPSDEIDYRGQKIKLSKSYDDFDVYKNDPNNIHTSETGRVQHLVTTAPIDSDYSSRRDVFRATGAIQFPGYGVGSGEGRGMDGSELLVVTIEIPRAGKDRYLVFRGRQSRFHLIDDFVHDEISYPFEIHEESEAYVYRDGRSREYFRRPRR